MQLIFSYFDEIRGPEVLLAFPREITENTQNIISNFMQIHIDNQFFTFHPSNPNLNQYMYTFRQFIPSPNARGSQILIQLTGIFQINIEPAYMQTAFADIMDKIRKIPNIESLLLPQSPFYADRVNRTYKLLEQSFVEMNKKEEEFIVIDRLFSQSALTPDSPPALVSKTLARAFISSIDLSVPEGPKILFDVGQTVGHQLSPIIQGTEIDVILAHLTKFWKAQAFGIIDELKITDEGIYFNVYDCFECVHVPKIGRTVCKFDEGLLTALLKTKLNQTFEVKELECFGTGYNHCRFMLKPIKKSS